MTTILIVEDNKNIRENLAEMLSIAKYNVKAVENGKLAITELERILPDIIICDIIMPEMNGYELLEAVRNNSSFANIRFIFLTALAEEYEIKNGLEMGANKYIVKPFEETQILSAIDSLL